MVSKKNILATIEMLDEKYNVALSSENPQSATFYAKLALLEYCGWLEETFDDIVRVSVEGELKTETFKDILEKQIIEKTYGFQYHVHFMPMLMRAIGIVQVEKLERELNKGDKLVILKSELGQVKKARDSAAHTWIKGTTQIYQAPSWLKDRLEKVYPIIELMDSKILCLKQHGSC